MLRLLLQLLAGILGIFLSQRYVPGVEFIGSTQTLILTGVILGLINFFIKPILKVLTFPLKILTFGLFGLVINLLIIWGIDIIFPELIITGLFPLFLTSLVVWAINFILTKLPLLK